MFIFHFTKQPSLAGTSLYALIIRVSRDLRFHLIFPIISRLNSGYIRKSFVVVNTYNRRASIRVELLPTFKVTGKTVKNSEFIGKIGKFGKTLKCIFEYKFFG
jgi:hypothetical protein